MMGRRDGGCARKYHQGWSGLSLTLRGNEIRVSSFRADSESRGQQKAKPT
jgi:hypothetical protein